MKININILFALACLLIIGCKDQDETYRDFVIPGGIAYPGKPMSVSAHPGKNRIQLTWLRSRDPRVTSARIFWNNYRDSVSLDIPRDMDTIKYVFDNFEEGIYTFFVKTYDALGNVSIPVEVNGRVLGAQYEQSLLTRGLNGVSIDGDGVVEFNWAVADTVAGAIATEVLYRSTTGQQKRVLFSAQETASKISDYQPGEPVQYRTLYLPDTLAIDTFYTTYSATGDFFFKKKGWRVIDFSNQHSAGENAVENLIDDNAATRWHSNARAGFNYPHWVTIDLGIRKTISSVRVWRTTMEVNDVRGPDNMQFLVSDDLVDWTDLGTYKFNRFIDGPQAYPLPETVAGRYFKLIGIDGPQTYIVLGELDLYVK